MRAVGHAAGRRARRRSADRRPHGAARQGARVPRRPAGHRRRDARHRPHGARRQGQPRHRVGDQRARPARGRPERRGRRAHRRRARTTPTSASSATSHAVNPAILERLLAEDLIPVVVHDRRRRRRARRTTSTPTPSPARSPRRSAPRSSSTSPTSRACCRDVDDPGDARSAASPPTSSQALIDDGALTGGMIPKVARVRARGRARRRVAPTSSTAASPTCCCSSCSPTKAIGTMILRTERPSP